MREDVDNSDDKDNCKRLDQIKIIVNDGREWE